ncbi:MAG: glycine cleavage system protein GcvH [Myxococcota bacterium]|nr:glycine cleavage system protein GcvH [Myxococcota bacterium]
MSDYELPEENRYSGDDEWVRETDSGVFRIGISDYAQQQLGDVVFVELPAPGAKFDTGQAFGVIESVKAVSDLCMPMGGEIVEVNSALEDAPETVNEDCYGEGWLIAVRPLDVSGLDALMDAAAYAKLLAERSD